MYQIFKSHKLRHPNCGPSGNHIVICETIRDSILPQLGVQLKQEETVQTLPDINDFFWYVCQVPPNKEIKAHGLLCKSLSPVSVSDGNQNALSSHPLPVIIDRQTCTNREIIDLIACVCLPTLLCSYERWRKSTSHPPDDKWSTP